MVFSGFFDEPKRARPRFTPKEKDALYKQQGGKCNGCNKKFEMRNMAVDHIRAFAKGGGERLTNLQLLCTACNSLKGDGTMAQLKKRLQAQGIIKTSSKAASTSKKSSASKAKSGTRAAPKKRVQKKPRDPFADLFNF